MEIFSSLIWISPRATGWLLARIQTSSFTPASSGITAPRPMRSSCCMGSVERPSTTWISTLTALTWLTGLRPRLHTSLCAEAARAHIGRDMLDRVLNPDAKAPLFGRDDGIPAGWAVSQSPVAYPDAVAAMEARAAAIADGGAGELVWLLEHPPLYTAGVSAKPGDLLEPDRFPVFQTGRGGQFTYHGPGQRVAYVMLDLSRRQKDVRAFVGALEAWVIGAL